MKSNSFVEIAKDKVTDQCSKVIDNIRARREKDNKTYILNKMRKLNKPYLFKKLFGGQKFYSFEEAKETCDRESNDIFQLVDYPSEYGWGTLALAMMLHRAAKESNGDIIHVSIYDMSLIF